MRSRILTELLLVASLSAFGVIARAQEFSCGSRHCVIPYDSKGVQNGVEVCYAEEDKKTKVRELTWKNGVRRGPARCFRDGKIKLQVEFKNNVFDGPYVEKAYDSRGDRITFYQGGRRLGYQLHWDESTKKAEVAGCFDGDEWFEGYPRECEKQSYGKYESTIRSTIAKQRAANAKLKAEHDRKANGKQVEKYPDGKMRAEYTTKNGEIVGLAKAYHQNGKLKSETTYDEAGKKTGESVIYDEQGRVDSKHIFENDMITSETEYDDNGKPTVARKWEGARGKRRMCVTSFYDTGAKMRLHCMKETHVYYYYSYSYWGDYDGPYRMFDEDGKVILTGEYENGDRVGTWKQTSSDGSWKSETTYEKGRPVKELEIRDGERLERTFNPDGSMKSERRSRGKMI